MKKPQTDRSDRMRVHREMFWHNVMREFLTGLSVSAMSGQGNEGDGPNLFDGRLGVITATGTRIPIAGVYPLFACGVPGSDTERSLSMDVECTIFQIHTPEGEVFTLPLHEIVGFHSVGEEVMEQLNAAAQENSSSDEPFGFAAFTSLAKQSRGDAEMHGKEAPGA